MAFLHDFAVAEVQDAVGHFGHGGVVGDDDGQGAEFAVDALHGLQNGDAGGDVERAGGLVAEQDLGFFRDGAGDGHALLFTTAELGWEVVHAVAEAHHGERFLWLHRLRRDLGDEGHVFSRGEAGDEVVELENEAHAVPAEERQRAFVAAEVPAFVADRALGGRV